MAGERLSKLTIEASFAINDRLRGFQAQGVRFLLAGAWIEYRLGAYTSRREYIAPDPDDVGRDYVKQAVENLIALIKFDILSRGLPYTVSAVRDLGNSVFSNQPRIQFDIEAGLYQKVFDLDFQDFYTGADRGWTVVQKLTSLIPLQVQQTITHTGVYGSTDGSITLVGYDGNTRPLTYQWADGFTGPQRDNLPAGTYKCIVSDADGVSTTVTCVVKSDDQLQVLVQQTETSITLVVSGGVAPYEVRWDDGATTLERKNLTPGTYEGTVSDARGAAQRVKVVLASNRCYFSQNPIELALDAGPAYRNDPTTKPNLSFVAQVWVEKEYLSGVYQQVGPQLEQPADLQGRTVFDVQRLLDAYVREHLPPLEGPLVAQAQDLFKRFYLKTAEKYGTPPVEAPLSSAQVNYVLCGGLSPAEAAAGRWPSYQTTVKPFLTWEPDNQRVLPRQPAYLYYQHVGLAGPVALWVRVRHVDGSTSHGSVASFEARRWEVYYLCVGPAALGLTDDDVVGYDVWVQDDAGVLASLVRHFTLDRAYYPQQRYFVYSNSLGGANVLAALGAAKQTLEVKAEEADRPAYDPDLGDVDVLERTGTATMSVITGPRRRGQVQADQELLLSKRVALLKDGYYWPGRVVPATFTVKDEALGLASLAFDFVLPKGQHFSPRLPLLVAGQAITPAVGGEGPTP